MSRSASLRRLLDWHAKQNSKSRRFWRVSTRRENEAIRFNFWFIKQWNNLTFNPLQNAKHSHQPKAETGTPELRPVALHFLPRNSGARESEHPAIFTAGRVRMFRPARLIFSRLLSLRACDWKLKLRSLKSHENGTNSGRVYNLKRSI